MENRILRNPGQVIAGCKLAATQFMGLSAEDYDDTNAPVVYTATNRAVMRLAEVAVNGSTYVRRVPHFTAFAAGFGLLLVLGLGMRRIVRRLPEGQKAAATKTRVYQSLCAAGDMILTAVEATNRVKRSELKRTIEMPDFSANQAGQALYTYAFFTLHLFDEAKLSRIGADELKEIDSELEGIITATDGLGPAALLMADWLTQENARVEASSQPEEKMRKLRAELAATIRALA